MTTAALNFFGPQSALQILGDSVTAAALGELLPEPAARTAQAHPRLAQRMGLQRCEDSVGSGPAWRLCAKPRWRLQWLQPGDMAAWHALFQACFGYAMPEAQRQWKYQGAACMGLGVWRGDALVAFYGGMPRAVRYLGKAATAVQIGDVMVHPSQRGAFTRNGPFQMAAATYLEQCIGDGLPYLLGFGFPEDKALKLAEHLALYAKVDSMVELRWPSLAKQRSSWSSFAQVLVPSEAARHAPAVEALWQRMQRSFSDSSIVGVRNWAFIQARYLLHPLQPYILLWVRQRLSGRVLGLAVLRNRQEQNQGLELVDLLAPISFFAHMVRACRRFAAGLGCAELFVWVTQSHAHLLADASSQQSPLNLAIPANVWSPGPSLDTLRGRWWLMGGDTDFR